MFRTDLFLGSIAVWGEAVGPGNQYQLLSRRFGVENDEWTTALRVLYGYLCELSINLF